MATDTTERSSARERLLAAASELFYEQGVHTVGIDKVIERAGVAKASLYNTFGSKDELVRVYLQGRDAVIRERITCALQERYTNARDRLLGIFQVQGEQFAKPGYRGCAFVGASAESPSGGPVEQVSDEFRRWLRALFVELAGTAGAHHPEQLAQQLVLLYDGAGVGAWMDRDPTTATAAQTVATTLIDAAIKRNPSIS